MQRSLIIRNFRAIFNLRIPREEAIQRLKKWCETVRQNGSKAFKTVAKTVLNNIHAISNYFIHRATNAFAESFNAKVKLFRTQLRGLSDPLFFVYRLTTLFA